MTTEKTHWKKEFNYDFLGSYSLPDGKDVILTIKSTKRETVTGTNGKKEECFTCYFIEADKPMILNRTNCKTITNLAGSPYIEDWVGLRIQLGIDNVNAFGETVEALRVRKIKVPPATKIDYTAQIEQLRSCDTLSELQSVYNSFTADQKSNTVHIKDEMKTKLTTAV